VVRDARAHSFLIAVDSGTGSRHATEMLRQAREHAPDAELLLLSAYAVSLDFDPRKRIAKLSAERFREAARQNAVVAPMPPVHGGVGGLGRPGGSRPGR
jgi:hypothetical protein